MVSSRCGDGSLLVTFSSLVSHRLASYYVVVSGNF